MASIPRASSLTEAPPLKFVGGDPSLDFVNTVDWTSAALVNERLVDYDRLVEWGVAAGLLDRGTRRRLLGRARAHPQAAQAALDHAWWARAVLQRMLASVATETQSPPALRDFNGLLREAGRHLRLAYGGRGADSVVWEPDRPDDLGIVVWTVARAAAALMESEGAQLRICAGSDCGWMYVDRSRNGLRRWCEMQTCGTMAKSRRRAVRAAVARA